jgi:hypothetical protein
VELNGATIINDARFDKATPMALDDRLGTPGPLLLQEHGSKVRFRNIRIRPLAAGGAQAPAGRLGGQPPSMERAPPREAGRTGSSE